MFAIVGGGLTATSMLCQLVDKLHHLGENGWHISDTPSILIFEKQASFGPGLPHNDHYVLPFHITNMCAKDMSVRWGNPGDFQNWVQQNYESLETRYPELENVLINPDRDSSDCLHFPRAVMGEYLKNQFHNAVDIAHDLGLSVELYPNCEVIDLSESGEQLHLTVRKNSITPSTIHKVDGVLLATGHWFEATSTQNYFSSPWPASHLLSGIPAAETVGVIGSSLSAIEVALTLTSDGHFFRQPSGELSYVPPDSPRKLILYSRNGLLPRVRGKTSPRQNLYLTCEHLKQLINDAPYQLTLSIIFDLLDRELRAAYGSAIDWQHITNPKGDTIQILQQDIRDAQYGDGPNGELIWQTILVQIFPVVRELYLNLTLDERKYFDRHFTTLFFMHAATQPVINAEKMLALMRTGIVCVIKLGDDYLFNHNETTNEFQFIYQSSAGDTRCDSYHYVVNARGQPRSLDSDSAALTLNLVQNELIHMTETRPAQTAEHSSYTTGSIVVDPETHQVIRPGSGCTSSSHPPIFAVGAMTRGQMIDASMAHGIARSTDVIAEHVITNFSVSKDI